MSTLPLSQHEAQSFASGKGHGDENFPVASHLVAPRFRAPIMAFYRFARAADDIADHPDALPEDKLAALARMRAGLDGEGAPEAMALAASMAQRGIDPVHAHELLDAFVQDVTVRRYAHWDDLIAYCRLSAVPVGRFVLDVHGESRDTWPANDALCAALQINNHLQDCAKDYAAIDRVYLPTTMLEAAGARVEDLAAPASSRGLREVIVECARRTGELLAQSAPFARSIRDRRLGAEVAVIQALAEDLCTRLQRQDPLAVRIEHSKPQAALIAARAVAAHFLTGRRR